MKTFNLTTLLFLSVLLSSCSQHEENEKSSKPNDLVNTKQDTNHISKKNSLTMQDGVHSNDTTVYEGSPQITSLPFGFIPTLRNFDVAQSYFIKLSYQDKSIKTAYQWPLHEEIKQKIYRLPPIRSIKYIALPYLNQIDTGVCEDGKPFSDHIILTKYRYRLPDINNYQCYYWCDYQYYNDKKYSDTVRQSCSVFLSDGPYGYFILYEPKSQSAKVFTIYFDTEYDYYAVYRFFHIEGL